MSTTNSTAERLLDIFAVADQLAVPVQTVRRWRYLNVGPRSIKVGRHVRYRQADIDAWLESQASHPQAG